MTPLTSTVGKLLCMSLLIAPSKLVEGRLISPLLYGRTSRANHLTNLHAHAIIRDESAARHLLALRAAARARKAEMRMISLEALELSADLQLTDSGLDRKAFECGLLGYHHLIKQGRLHKTSLLTICDFGQPSNQKRMYIIDMHSRKLLFRTYVAHGEGSGQTIASEFSNRPESHKSSLGFYVTRTSYYGTNGLSLRIDGLDKGFNSLAGDRNIVIHGAPYVSERILKKYGMLGTTFGCPAIPDELSADIIDLLKGGSCFFIYAPSGRYLNQSTVLNGI